MVFVWFSYGLPEGTPWTIKKLITDMALSSLTHRAAGGFHITSTAVQRGSGPLSQVKSYGKSQVKTNWSVVFYDLNLIFRL